MDMFILSFLLVTNLFVIPIPNPQENLIILMLKPQIIIRMVIEWNIKT